MPDPKPTGFRKAHLVNLAAIPILLNQGGAIDFARLPIQAQNTYIQIAYALNYLSRTDTKKQHTKTVHKPPANGSSTTPHQLQERQIQRTVRTINKKPPHVRAAIRDAARTHEREQIANNIELSGHNAQAVKERRAVKTITPDSVANETRAKQILGVMNLLGDLAPAWVNSYLDSAFLQGADTNEVLTQSSNAISESLGATLQKLSPKQIEAVLQLDADVLKDTPLASVISNVRHAVGKRGVEKMKSVREWVDNQLTNGVFDGSPEQMEAFTNEVVRRFAQVSRGIKLPSGESADDYAILLGQFGLVASFLSFRLRRRHVLTVAGSLIFLHAAMTYGGSFAWDVLAQNLSQPPVASSFLADTSDGGDSTSTPGATATPTSSQTPVSALSGTPPFVINLPFIIRGGDSTTQGVTQTLERTPTPQAASVVEVHFSENAEQVVFTSPGSYGKQTSVSQQDWEFTGASFGDFAQVENIKTGELGWVAKTAVDNEPADLTELDKSEVPWEVFSNSIPSERVNGLRNFDVSMTINPQTSGYLDIVMQDSSVPSNPNEWQDRVFFRVEANTDGVFFIFFDGRDNQTPRWTSKWTKSLFPNSKGQIRFRVLNDDSPRVEFLTVNGGDVTSTQNLSGNTPLDGVRFSNEGELEPTQFTILTPPDGKTPQDKPEPQATAVGPTDIPQPNNTAVPQSTREPIQQNSSLLAASGPGDLCDRPCLIVSNPNDPPASGITHQGYEFVKFELPGAHIQPLPNSDLVRTPASDTLNRIVITDGYRDKSGNYFITFNFRSLDGTLHTGIKGKFLGDPTKEGLVNLWKLSSPNNVRGLESVWKNSLAQAWLPLGSANQILNKASEVDIYGVTVILYETFQ